MEYIKQFFIIIAISFLGEILNHFIPLPVPASIYGLVIMLILLMTGILKLKNVKKVSDFLIKIMPIMFIAPCVGLMISINEIKTFLIPFIITVFVSTFLTMAISGVTAEFIIRKKERKGEAKDHE